MYDIVIIGSGPAGLTAGIYAGRAGLNTIILDKARSGGTANIAPLVENYPGIEMINGDKLMETMTKQTLEHAEIKEFSHVDSIEKNEDSSFTIKTSKETYKSKHVLLATGSNSKTLDVEGISEFTGRGVSYCAVCDGNFFIDREVIIVGGGNSAATEALYLNRIGVKCSIVHRRDKLRCDAKLVKDIQECGINVYWNCEVKAVKGEGIVNKVVLYNNKTHEEKTIDVNGVFIAIGYSPNNELAKKIGVKCDDSGYIIVDENMQTNIKGVFAAGDITGGIKQIVISTAQGAKAATKIEELMLYE